MLYFAMPHTQFTLVLILKLNAKGNILGMPGSAEKDEEVEERSANESGYKGRSSRGRAVCLHI